MNNRCEWAKHSEEIIYHDKEWSFPVMMIDYFLNL